jgi:hypothetical protein
MRGRGEVVDDESRDKPRDVPRHLDAQINSSWPPHVGVVRLVTIPGAHCRRLRLHPCASLAASFPLTDSLGSAPFQPDALANLNARSHRRSIMSKPLLLRWPPTPLSGPSHRGTLGVRFRQNREVELGVERPASLMLTARSAAKSITTVKEHAQRGAQLGCHTLKFLISGCEYRE